MREKMGMTINNTCEPKPMSKEEIVDTLKTMTFGVQAFERFNAKERETLDKAWNIIDQYEARLKADMVAMLEEIQLEIEENTVRWYVGRVDGKSDDVVLIDTLNEIIEQKINKLKENK